MTKYGFTTVSALLMVAGLTALSTARAENFSQPLSQDLPRHLPQHLTENESSVDPALDAALSAFSQDSQTFMNSPIAKQGATTSFSQQDIDSKDFVAKKDSLRAENFPDAVFGLDRAIIEANDKPEDVVDKLLYTNLPDMEKNLLTEGKVPASPWSDDYWAIYTDVIAKRYADTTFPMSDKWKENSDYVKTALESSPIIQSSVDILSPAEKYDLLVGDKNWTLTKYMLNQGKSFYDKTGKVETWMGICHGWAPAAYTLSRPAQKITVKAADGITDIMFYPSDLKALGSALYANGIYEQKFIGGRCDKKNPATEPSGRIIDQSCFDTNPGTFHQAVVNQIGAANKNGDGKTIRSLVMDATYDVEVWNQPIYSYKYSYFNPRTRRSVKHLKTATAPKGFPNDKFANHRDASTVSIVGVAMDLTYVGETSPNHAETDAESNDRLVKVRYLYDLEIDVQGKIIGGEWYQNAHPDFLWTPSPGSRAVSPLDGKLKTSWDAKNPMPAEYRAAAARASLKGTPLAKVVEALFSVSAAGVTN